MRLHRLDISAFGPYPGAESVDFDALGVDGLFLLHGDTGAGKTTLLDGVAFALFGAVPGARGEAKRLRCDYASPDTTTEVRLELTVQGQRFRVARRPQYERSKRRGEGTTTEPVKATLTWIGGAPAGAPSEGVTRVDEVNRTVERLLGMTAAQFFQVVLLPQGEFAKFLRADTTEREQLLERLFGTERFADVERWFAERRRVRRAGVEQRQLAVRDLVTRLAQESGTEPPESHQQVDEDWIAALRGDLAARTIEVEQQDKLARYEREQIEAELHRRTELAGRVRRVRLATETVVELAKQAESRDEWAAELSAARRAVPVVAVHESAEPTHAELTAADNAERAAAAALAAAGESDVDAEAPALRARAGWLTEEAGRLRQLVAEVKRHQDDRARLASLTEAEQRAQRTVGDLVARLAELPAAIVRARSELDAAAQADARLTDLRSRLAECESLAEDAARLPVAEREAALAREKLSQATDRHQLARQTLLDIRERRLAGMAAELAGALAVGEQCPVCGSAEHPEPAVASEPVGEADERAATEAEQRALRVRERAERDATVAGQQVAALVGKLGDRGADRLAGELATLREELRVATDLAAGVHRLATRVQALDAESERITGERRSAEDTRAQLVAERDSLSTVVNEREQRLTAARGEYPSVSARRDALLAMANAGVALADARGARAAAELRWSAAQQAVWAAAEQAGFADGAQAIAAARDQAEVADLERRLTEARHREATAAAVLAEPELAGIDPATEVDLDGARLAAAEARIRAEEAHAALDAARRRERNATALADRLAVAWAELAPVEAEFAELSALTDVVNGRGQNARQMSLRSYVLAARLEEVGVAATRQLRRMSEGRYSFVHTDARGTHGKRGGLGLDVLDDYSGQIRPTKTLSGGESFLASLALALGLADVVAAETGGAMLDTLFVDEGFGTLDADTLDLVMDTLDELRAGGRVVGLVSHVEELRQRIPVRLRVRKARTGSTVELTASAA
ncbi:MAG TPA: SMC family ATPase [Pseudonocardiaceae bacterium]|nr:SMC family ATPase [Pseudonocardiaceae bacterium]